MSRTRQVWVTSAALVASSGHSYCDVRGVTRPRTHFEIKLPTIGWQGHTGSDQTDGRWGKNDPRARVVFGITSEHSLARLATAVITRYYGRPPAYTYFDGCSTGGRQALILAQRYPTDFNGMPRQEP